LLDRRVVELEQELDLQRREFTAGKYSRNFTCCTYSFIFGFSSTMFYIYNGFQLTTHFADLQWEFLLFAAAGNGHSAV